MKRYVVYDWENRAWFDKALVCWYRFLDGQWYAEHPDGLIFLRKGISR